MGGLTGLDAASCAQTMIARPLVAGPLAGLILGDPLQGMAVGVLLEVLTLYQLPVGATRRWDTGPAAVVGVAALASSPGGVAAALVAVGLGALVAWAGSWSVHVLRHFNSTLVVVEGPAVQPTRLASGHLGAMVLDFARGTALTAIGVLLAVVISGAGGGGGSGDWAARPLLLLAVGLVVGADVRAMVGQRRVWGLFAAAAAVSAILILWLG